MSLSATDHAQLGRILYDAMRANTPIQPLTKTHPTITVEDAYQISRTMLSHRLERDREVVVGKKIGVTSDAVQSMLGVFQPDFGFLTNTMTFANKSNIRIAGNMISPRAEGEIAFRLKSTLCGTANTEVDVMAAPNALCPALKLWIPESKLANRYPRHHCG